MSAKKEDRWAGMLFRRTIGRYSLEVEADDTGWSWYVFKGYEVVADGLAPDEKTAKLKARLVVDRRLRFDAKRGGR